MSNNNAPFGLRQEQSATGAGSNFEMIYRQIAYDNATAIYTNDPVKQLDTGYIAQWSAGTAVSQMIGIFMGCEFLSALTGKMTSSPYWPGSGQVASTAQSTIIAKIAPINLAIPSRFIVQSDATGVAFADIGMNIDLAMGTGSTITGISGAYLNLATLNTTATLPFRIVGLYGGLPGAGGAGGIQPGSTGPYSGSATGAYNWAVVMSNNVGTTGI